MSARKLLAELAAEVQLAKRKAFEVRWKRDLKENKARLAYEKIRCIKAKQPVNEIDRKLKKLEAGEIEYPDFPAGNLLMLAESENDTHNLKNLVTFLQNQRVYNELLERYNPGLTMTQEDNVRKTANMVGLSVPEN